MFASIAHVHTLAKVSSDVVVIIPQQTHNTITFAPINMHLWAGVKAR